MSQPTTKRPPQVTLAGTVAIVASVLVVLTVWEQVATLRSLETREAMERFLTEPLGSSLGLDVEAFIRVRHAVGLVAAGCAAATAILGWFVLRRDTSARLALSVLAVPLFLTGLVARDFWSSFVAAAAAMLWLSPAREWFATGSWTPPQSRRSTSTVDQGRSGPSTPGPPPGAMPGPPTPDASAAAPYAERQAHPHPWTPVPRERPGVVVTAAVIAIVMSVLVGLMAVLVIVVVAMSPDVVMGELQRQQPELSEGITLAQVRFSAYVGGAASLLLSALALAFAGFVLVGRDWARWGLMLTAAFSAGASLLFVLSLPVAALPAAAGVATVVLLRHPEARAWCEESRAGRRG